MCNALIDTGTTKIYISERYYQQLPSTKNAKVKEYMCKISHG